MIHIQHMTISQDRGTTVAGVRLLADALPPFCYSFSLLHWAILAAPSSGPFSLFFSDLLGWSWASWSRVFVAVQDRSHRHSNPKTHSQPRANKARMATPTSPSVFHAPSNFNINSAINSGPPLVGLPSLERSARKEPLMDKRDQ